MSNVKSPCISVCSLGDKNFCIGCGRTIKEISEWSKLSDHEKTKVIEKCKKRIKIYRE